MWITYIYTCVFLGKGYRTLIRLSMDSLIQTFIWKHYFLSWGPFLSMSFHAAFWEGNDECCVSRLWAEMPSCRTNEAGPWQVGMSWASGEEGQAFHERDWHGQRHKVGAHRAYSGHSGWANVDGLQEGAPGDKVNKEVRPKPVWLSG